MSVQRQLEGKVALVTGANRGIGLAIAKKLVGMGAKVSISARNEEKLRQAAKEIGRDGTVTPVRADVTRGDEIAQLVRETESSLGPIDILVNNAGIGVFGPVQNLSETEWDAVLDTNLKAVFLLSRAVAPGMIERRSGEIINIASLAGKNTFAGGAIYCASKWGLLGLTQSMAEDLRSYGIRVSAICPGSVATEFSPPQGKKDQSKMLQPRDVAHAVEMILAQARESFISEIVLRPREKP